jgi:hypothetical protein
MDLKELAKVISTKKVESVSNIDPIVRESLKEMGYVKVNEDKVKSIIELMSIAYLWKG